MLLPARNNHERCRRKRALLGGWVPHPVLISIVMPVQKPERYVEDAIRSVLGSDLSVAVDDRTPPRSPGAQYQSRMSVLANN